MDARITKSRLANMFSYDWLKIVAAIAAAVLAICVFFTTVKTRPGKYHVFTVYGYRELVAGESAGSFLQELKDNGTLSYDVLDTSQETFGTGQYAEAAFAARRSTAQGNVMFTTTNRTSEEDASATVIGELLGGENCPMALDLDVYLNDCQNYLIRFFGEDWQAGQLDREEAEACFLARNGKDRRFRTEAKKAEGVLQEYGRLEQLRKDYIYVCGCVENGTLSYVDVADEKGVLHHKAFALGKLAGLRNYYYYTETTKNEESGEETVVTSSANVCLFLFSNDNDEGRAARYVENDLRYEPISYVRALVERFGT